jgi:hypothetical protein
MAPLTLEVSPDLLQRLQQEAARMGQSTEVLAEIWLVERLQPSTPNQDQLRTALKAGGLTLAEPLAEGPAPLSPEARAALAREVPPGRPLSEIISEERNGR